MKQIYGTIAAAALTACLAAFLCACGGDAEPPTEAASDSPTFASAEVFTLPEETETTVPASEDASAKESETKKADAKKTDGKSTTAKKKDDLPDEQTILGRVDEARTVYGLFGEYRPAMDKNDVVTGDNETPFYRVKDTKFDTMDKLMKYVGKYFSGDVTEALINVGLYMESDGKLYAVDAAMEMDSPDTVLERHAKVTSHTKDSQDYLVTLTVDTDGDGKADGKQEYRSTYAKQGDKWVFTSFEMF